MFVMLVLSRDVALQRLITGNKYIKDRAGFGNLLSQGKPLSAFRCALLVDETINKIH